DHLGESCADRKGPVGGLYHRWYSQCDSEESSPDQRHIICGRIASAVRASGAVVGCEERCEKRRGETPAISRDHAERRG
ncbi:hypothetical protein HN011_003154, partial [Eciton burchellii]